MSVNIEKLINEQIAKAIVQEVLVQLEPQWNKVLTEMVASRKTQFKLTSELNLLKEQVACFDVSLLKQQQLNTEKDLLQQKEGKILDFLIHEFGIKVGGR